MRVAVIGAGNVGSMIIDLLLQAGLDRDDIIATARSEERLSEICSRFKVRVTRSNREAVKHADIVFLCVKPKDAFSVFNELKGYVEDKLVVSCIALLSEQIVRSQCNGRYVCRLMPVLSHPYARPLLFLYRGSAAENQVQLLTDLLKHSKIIPVESEDTLDILTVYACSGLAFLYYLLKSYVWGGVAIGLKFDRAQRILAELTEIVTELLRGNVDEETVLSKIATPGGLTVTGLLEAEINSVRGHVIKMLVKAWEKARRASRELTRLAKEYDRGARDKD